MTMETALEITVTNGACRLDSRVLARRLGYEHRILKQAIERHRASLEKKSFLHQLDAKTTSDKRGRGRPETCYLLDERQCLILTGRLKKGEEAEEWHDTLVEAFLQARDRVRQLEAKQSQSTREQPPFNWLLHNRLKLFVAKTRLRSGYWCVFKEVASYAYLYPTLIDAALPDGSVGKRWMRYVREHPEKFDLRLIKTYDHWYPDKRGKVQANQYPNEWLAEFRIWFEENYLKKHLQNYLKPRTQALPQAGNQRALPEVK